VRGAAVTDYSFNFRGTTAFVTDPVGDIPIVATTPLYSGGQGYGYEGAAASTRVDESNTGWGSGDYRLAGSHNWTGIGQIFRNDMANGSYKLRLAEGFDFNPFHQSLAIWDGYCGQGAQADTTSGLLDEWAAGQTSITTSTYRIYGANLYKAFSGTTTGATPPTHTAGTVSDGGVSWTFVKTALLTLDVTPANVFVDGAGGSWAAGSWTANNVQSAAFTVTQGFVSITKARSANYGRVRHIGLISQGTPAPVFSVNPSISPGSGTAGSTTFTATDGTASNTTGYTRRWLLDGVSIGTGTTVLPSSAGSLVLEVTATGSGGSTIANSSAVTVSAAAIVTSYFGGGTAIGIGNGVAFSRTVTVSASASSYPAWLLLATIPSRPPTAGGSATITTANFAAQIAAENGSSGVRYCAAGDYTSVFSAVQSKNFSSGMLRLAAADPANPPYVRNTGTSGSATTMTGANNVWFDGWRFEMPNYVDYNGNPGNPIVILDNCTNMRFTRGRVTGGVDPTYGLGVGLAIDMLGCDNIQIDRVELYNLAYGIPGQIWWHRAKNLHRCLFRVHGFQPRQWFGRDRFLQLLRREQGHHRTVRVLGQ
jgi:hypothetical protein